MPTPGPAEQHPRSQRALTALAQSDLHQQGSPLVLALQANLCQCLLCQSFQCLLRGAVHLLRRQALKAVTRTRRDRRHDKAADLAVNPAHATAARQQKRYKQQSYQRFIHMG